MKRLASVTFDAVLAEGERDDAVRLLASAGAHVTSWSGPAARTCALVELQPGAAPDLTGARVDEPPLAMLRVTPDRPATLADLQRALGGPGRPVGVLEATLEPDAVVVLFAPHVTSLELLVALIDAVLAREPGRRIEPLLPLDDATLAAFAGALLGEPHLDAARLIEAHLEPLLEKRLP